MTGDLGYLLQQEQVTIKFNVKVNDNAPTAGTTDITSTVTISSITKDPNTANNTNSEATDVLNPPPVDGDESVTTLEDNPISGNVLDNATDPNNDPVSVTQFVVGGTTYSAGQTATLLGVGTLVINANGSYTFTPAANYNGAVPVATYTVSDGKGGTDTSTLTISITPVNDAPIAVNDSYTTQEDTPLTIAVPGVLGNDTDVDGDTLTVTEFTQPTNGTLTQNEDGSFSYSPNANYNGSDSFTYTISDGKGGTSTATVNIGVTSVNDAPTAVNDTLSGTEDTSLTITSADLFGADGTGALNDFDIDSANFSSITVTTLATNGTLLLDGKAVTLNQVITAADIANNKLTFTPNADFNGAAVFNYTVSDGALSSNVATVTINVAAVNDAPVDYNESVITPEDTPISGNLLTNASDVDGDTLTVSTFTLAGNNTTYNAGQTATLEGVGTLLIGSNGSYTFTPAANYNGAVPVASYTVSDGKGGSDTSTLAIAITPVNDAPVAVNDTLSGTQNTSLTITSANLFGADGTGMVNDYDIDSASFSSISVTSLATNGTLLLNGTAVTLNQVISAADLAANRLTFTPNSGFSGAASFNYTVSDGALSSNVATVTINMAPLQTATGPGVGTPGFWQNNTAVWDGNTSNDSTFNTRQNFAKADILYRVVDPVTGTQTAANGTTDNLTGRGILIGDFNRDGLTNPGERTIYYSVAEARDILNASVSGDSRYTVAKHLIASWLNVIAGNEYTQIQTDINNGIQWLQNSTPAETGRGAGGKDAIGDGSLTLNASSRAISGTDSRWNTSLGSVSGTKMHYGSQINGVLDYYNNEGAGFANDRDTGVIGGNLSTLSSLQAYQQFF